MDMTMANCREFVSVLASDAPAPGGGGAAALVGAIGTALGNMVGSLTPMRAFLLNNLLPVTIGNIIGGAGVGLLLHVGHNSDNP